MSKSMSALHQSYISQSLEQSLTPPSTPPWSRTGSKLFHNWPEPETEAEQVYHAKRLKTENEIEDVVLNEVQGFDRSHQEVLLLHAARQRYQYTKDFAIPPLEKDWEMLAEVEAIGLNPIDWKAPDYGFGLPALPCISGRDFTGRIVRTTQKRSRFRLGDRIMAVSTDYRDSRKSAFQQYAIVSDFNVCKLPPSLTAEEAAPLGVAFVAAALALGICLGVDFSNLTNGPRGPDLLRIICSLPVEAFPQDVRTECFEGIRESERPRKGDWIAIWGGSSASGCSAIQLAKLAGLRVIAVIDVARSGERMVKLGADLLVDRLDTERAIAILNGVTKGRLRFGLDTRGRESATLLAGALKAETEQKRAHLVGLTGVPMVSTNGVVYHTVPIKSFHEAHIVGESLMLWLEKLLDQKVIVTPDIEVVDGGLEAINDALDKLRDGTVNGPRIVVPLRNA